MPHDPDPGGRARLVPTFSTLGCPDLEFDQAVMLARSHGLRTLELRALGGTADLPAYFARRYGDPEQLAAVRQRLGIAIAGVGTSLRLIGNTEETRAGFLRYVPWAVALGSSFLRVFDGGESADADELAAARRTLAWWDALKNEHGWPIDLMVETHDALVHPQALQTFLDRHPDRKLLWDSHHTWRRGGEHPVRTWQRVREATVHIHVKDSIAVAGHHPDHSYVQLGRGDFPIGALLETLATDAYAGAISLEWERLWHADLSPLDDVLPDFQKLFSEPESKS